LKTSQKDPNKISNALLMRIFFQEVDNGLARKKRSLKYK